MSNPTTTSKPRTQQITYEGTMSKPKKDKDDPRVVYVDATAAVRVIAERVPDLLPGRIAQATARIALGGETIAEFYAQQFIGVKGWRWSSDEARDRTTRLLGVDGLGLLNKAIDEVFR